MPRLELGPGQTCLAAAPPHEVQADSGQGAEGRRGVYGQIGDEIEGVAGREGQDDDGGQGPVDQVRAQGRVEWLRRDPKLGPREDALPVDRNSTGLISTYTTDKLFRSDIENLPSTFAKHSRRPQHHGQEVPERAESNQDVQPLDGPRLAKDGRKEQRRRNSARLLEIFLADFDVESPMLC